MDNGLVGLDGGSQGGVGAGNNGLAVCAPGAIEAILQTRMHTLVPHPHRRNDSREELATEWTCGFTSSLPWPNTSPNANDEVAVG